MFRQYKYCQQEKKQKTKNWRALLSFAKGLKPGGYSVTPADFLMIDKWILQFGTNGFCVMPYPFAFDYNPWTDPMPYVTGFPRNAVQYAGLARCPWSQADGFVTLFASRFTDVDFHRVERQCDHFQCSLIDKSSQEKSQGSHWENLRIALVWQSTL